MSQSKDFPDCFYRVSVRALIRDGEKFLMGKRRTMWETFGGGLDFGEDIQEGLKRELREEVGFKVVSIADKPCLALPHIVQKSRGMEWFYNFPIYYETVIEPDSFDPSREYSEVRWCTIDDIQSLDLYPGEEGIREGFKLLL
ncbi:MAG: NUDIX hydrolase [Patescibacteria group bacterium]